ncbi:UbiA prenyltransferase family [Hypoxylon rubiginosum]|uniref:UbiA prenyltransferase family n=1 Tax=Hypoxylon rubiginosum TaxID=110542 RepID=A0ACC0DHQ0_9PEZI|nr:UbiA prenyltransferase family [Hypoxylon rubiginosum]
MSESEAYMVKAESQGSHRETFRALNPLGPVLSALRLIWDFTESNFDTFVIPNTSFGILGALASSVVTEGSQLSATYILIRTPLVLLFNWCNVLNFDLANQRHPESLQEDQLNKPWRPIVVGKITPEQTRRLMLITIPFALLLNYLLGVWKQGVFILIITWLYNDIGGGDELIRDPLISISYGLFNSASLETAVGPKSRINSQGVAWVAIISGVILTTMQIQDLKDQAGDRTRGRKSIVLVFGDTASRASIAVFICLWSFICPYFWGVGLPGYVLSGVPGAVVALNVVSKRTREEDARSWRWWCFWMITLYTQVILYNAGL